MQPEDTQLQSAMQERFTKLPKVVQDAITSADVEKHLRELANTHKLHLDQWTKLENEVMLALLGFEPVGDLAKNIKSEVGTDEASSIAIAADISKIVFEPIRGELERLLEHPEAKSETVSSVDTVRTQVLASTGNNTPTSSPAPSVAPATPPAPAPETKVERAALTPSYAPSVASHERKTIEGDPYREQLA
jgi:hypothetical protein